MKSKTIVESWFAKWSKGDFMSLPLSEDFTHESPFGIIEGRSAYLQLVQQNQEKFVGYQFEIHDGFYEEDKACVRYTTRQGESFKMDVSEWYYLKGNQICSIIAHYHIGEIREDRKIENYDQ